MRSAARLGTLGTEQAYVVLAAAKRLEAAGHKVVHLEIGEPDMRLPPTWWKRACVRCVTA